MSGSRAKALRSQNLWMDGKSQKVKRVYVESNHRSIMVHHKFVGVSKTLTNKEGTPRAIYQQLKKRYKAAA